MALCMCLASWMASWLHVQYSVCSPRTELSYYAHVLAEEMQSVLISVSCYGCVSVCVCMHCVHVISALQTGQARVKEWAHRVTHWLPLPVSVSAWIRSSLARPQAETEFQNQNDEWNVETVESIWLKWAGEMTCIAYNSVTHSVMQGMNKYIEACAAMSRYP